MSYSGSMHDHLDSDQHALISACGVNNEMYLAQLIADHNYVNRSASVFGFATYYRVKLGMYHYATVELEGFSGDLKKVQAYYLSEYGMDVSYSDIQTN